MGRHEKRDPGGAKRLEDLRHDRGRSGIETCCRLISKDDSRIGDDCASYAAALRFANGNIGRTTRCDVQYTEPLQRSHCGVMCSVAIVEPERKGDVVDQGEVVEETGLLEHEADSAPPEPRLLRQCPSPRLLIVVMDRAFLDGSESRKRVQQSALAAATASSKCGQGAWLQFTIHAAQYPATCNGGVPATEASRADSHDELRKRGK